MRYLYPCDIVGNAADGDGFVATFPDVPGAITGSFTFQETLILAEDCLVAALGAYIDRQRDLPIPSPMQDGQELLTVQPVIAAQLDLYTAMRKQNISRADLAERLGISVAKASKLLRLDYGTPISRIDKALHTLGCGLTAADRAA